MGEWGEGLNVIAKLECNVTSYIRELVSFYFKTKFLFKLNQKGNPFSTLMPQQQAWGGLSGGG